MRNIRNSKKNDGVERVDGVSEGIDFDAHYKVRGYSGIAFYLLGWETEPDDDTVWTGYENRTGRQLINTLNKK